MSSATRIDLQPAWVLHRRPYRETSALLELFTPDHGRLGAVARGVKGRERGGLIEPFVPLRVSWSGRGELKSVVDLEQAGRAYPLSGAALACGFYMAELIMALTRREEPLPRTWQSYAIALDGLAGELREPLLRSFELALLEESGYGLQLNEDIHGRPVDSAAAYFYIPDAGAVAQDAAAQAVCEAAVGVSGATLLALAAGERDALLREPGRGEARRLLRRVIKQRLNGRRLRSREMFRAAPAPAR